MHAVGPAPVPADEPEPPGPAVAILAAASTTPLTVMVVRATTTSGALPVTVTVLLKDTLCTARTATASVPFSRVGGEDAAGGHGGAVDGACGRVDRGGDDEVARAVGEVVLRHVRDDEVGRHHVGAEREIGSAVARSLSPPPPAIVAAAVDRHVVAAAVPRRVDPVGLELAAAYGQCERQCDRQPHVSIISCSA